MRAGRWIILILLVLLLLAGACLLHPLVRFTIALYLDQSQTAESVYLSSIRGLERLDGKARAQLGRYVARMANGYLSDNMTYDEVMAALAPLSRTDLPQEDIATALQTVGQMEEARAALAQADAYASDSDYARAILLYRNALIADDGAAYRLQQAETAYKNRLLEQSEAAMEAGQYDMAESALQDGLMLLSKDADMEVALEDVHRLQADEAYTSKVAEARRLLREEGPDAAFEYAADLRLQAPDAYEYEHLEQLIRLEYEDDICTRALSLPAWDACTLLEEGMRRLDSARMRSMYDDIRSTMTFYLVDMPLLRDDTANSRTGAESTFTRDDAIHSFYADLGELTFSLADGRFDTFTGTVAFPQGETSDLYRTVATLQIYGDGRLLAEFKDIDSSTAAMPFSLPVSDVRELTLFWSSEGANGWKDWGRFATMYDGRLIPSVGH